MSTTSNPKRPTHWLRVTDLITQPATPARAGKSAKPTRRGRYPMGRTAFYALEDFPKPVYLSPGLPVWDEAEVEAWERKRKAMTHVASRGGDMRTKAALKRKAAPPAPSAASKRVLEPARSKRARKVKPVESTA